MDNVLLIKLWFGNKKPNSNVYSKSFRTSLGTMYRSVELRVPHSGENLLIRGVIICGTCDFSGKALFLYMDLFNGKFGAKYVRPSIR